MDNDRKAVAEFLLNTYTINASAGPGGTISPFGTTTVNHGGSQTYTITPNSGYHVADVLIDSVSVGAVTSYTFNNVTANNSISASFAINTYTVTAPSGGNGSINCNSPVDYGSSSTCTIAPDPGYRLTALTDNGANVFGSVSGNSYIISNVTANHTISATFQTCSISLNPTQASLPASGGTGNTFSVTALAGCAWSAVSNDLSWITVTGGASGSGSDTVTYTVASNAAGARTGTIIIAGQTFTVNQTSANTFKTPVSGTIATDTTWTLANSPYFVTGAIQVNPGVTLTIQPGVVIKFAIGNL